MRKQRIEYDSPVDALVAITKRLSCYEDRYRISSEEFFDKFCKGLMEDSVDFVEWANEYQHYITIKLEIERQLQHVS
ncbi:MAG: antitoxin TumA [Planctomycetota bacterium]